MRHGFVVENTWFNPGYWHTGEDWYALDDNTAGAQVYAVADGDVVFAGANYPGRVVIIRHTDDLFSMYGHLDPELAVTEGQTVMRGDVIGTVLRRGDNVPDHLHFEIRTFLMTREVNGESPRYPFRCGRNCPPGPGYWPIDAPDLPPALGWLNPTHAIHRLAFPHESSEQIGEVIVATPPFSESVTLWRDVDDTGTPHDSWDELQLEPGARFPLLDVRVGPDRPEATGAEAYVLWYKIELPEGQQAWVQAAVSSTFETGSDGRASTIYFNFYPAWNPMPNDS
jgi:hypothetical protein